MTEPSPVVLVVDDEVQIRRFLRAGLELDGFVVQDAETGADALKWVTLKQPDLIILDLGLPDMDGGDVLERLRAWSSVPTIVLSVRSNEAEKVRLLESGADDYVVKPFGMAELLARAHAAMRRQVRAAAGEPMVKAGAADHRSRRPHRLAQRPARDHDAEGIQAPADPRPARRQRRHPPVSAQGGVGLAAHARHPLPAHLRAQAAAEDRGGPDAAAHPADRARHRLPAGAAGYVQPDDAVAALSQRSAEIGAQFRIVELAVVELRRQRALLDVQRAEDRPVAREQRVERRLERCKLLEIRAVRIAGRLRQPG